MCYKFFLWGNHLKSNYIFLFLGIVSLLFIGHQASGGETEVTTIFTPLLLSRSETLLRGRVWVDNNFNGIQDSGETGIGNVGVKLYDDLDNLINTTTTSGDGSYNFPGLEPGNYFLEFIEPFFYYISPKDWGSDDTKDSDADPVTGRTDVFYLHPGANVDHWDAGISNASASVGDYVWEDVKANGIQDSNEHGIGNVTVNLYDDLDNFVNTTTTSGDGSYNFTDLAPGNYALEIIPPNGYSISPKDQGIDDLKDSDADPATGRTRLFFLHPGELSTRWDMGIY
jgi:hypothetical protein